MRSCFAYRSCLEAVSWRAAARTDPILRRRRRGCVTAPAIEVSVTEDDRGPPRTPGAADLDSAGARTADKAALRREMRARRVTLSERERQRLSAAVSTRLLELLATDAVGSVALYAAIQSEVDLSTLAEQLRARG